MNKRDIALMLSFAATLDGRVAFDETAVQAWSLVLEPDIDGRWAMDYTKRHYGMGDDLLVPSVINRGWHTRVKHTPPEMQDSHCRRNGCPCTHTEPCYRGWIDRPDNTATAPCPVCRSSLAEVLSKIPPLGMREEHHQTMIRTRDQEL